MERNKNDFIVKMLFALALALLPMLFFAQILLPSWMVCIFVGCLFLIKMWFELMKDKDNKNHNLMNAIASSAVFTTLLTFFIVYYASEVSLPIAITVIVLINLNNVLKVTLFSKPMPEFIEAVDFCLVLFELLTLLAFAFIFIYSMLSSVALIALMLALIVSVGYKTFYVFKYTKISNIFKRKK